MEEDINLYIQTLPLTDDLTRIVNKFYKYVSSSNVKKADIKAYIDSGIKKGKVKNFNKKNS